MLPGFPSTSPSPSCLPRCTLQGSYTPTDGRWKGGFALAPGRRKLQTEKRELGCLASASGVATLGIPTFSLQQARRAPAHSGGYYTLSAFLAARTPTF